MFGELRAANPQNVTILFNIGLCTERLGELDTATEFYEQALAVSPRKLEPQDGLARIASRLRARQQLALHYGGAPR